MPFKRWLYSSQSWFKSREPDWRQRPFSPRSPWQAVAVLPWEGRGWSTGLRKPLSIPVCKKMFKVPSQTQTWHMQEDFRKQQKNIQRPGVRTFRQAESTPRHRSQGKPAATPNPHPGQADATSLRLLFPGIQWSGVSPAISRMRALILWAVQAEDEKERTPLLSLGLLSKARSQPESEQGAVRLQGNLK